MSDTEDILWDLSNTTSNSTNMNASSSAPDTDISRGVGYVMANADDNQDTEPPSVEEVLSS